MKKTLIALLCVLVACICFVACNSDLSGETSVSFTPSVSKALNQSAATSSSDLTDVDAYYWKYYCRDVAPSSTFANNDDYFIPFFKDETKGLGIITGVEKDNSYYFGLRGYSDPEFKNLVWEGYHYSDSGSATATIDKNSSSFAAVKLNSRTQLVTIDVFGYGSGYLEFDISAPYNYTAAQLSDSSFDKLSKDNFSDSYFKVEYSLIGSTEKDMFYLGKDAENLNEDYDAVGKDYRSWNSTTENVVFINKTADAAAKSLPQGVYLFTISQVYTVAGTELQVPNRKQVMIVNIVTGAKTVISGALDSTLGVEEFYYIAGGWTSENNEHMKVIFHGEDSSVISTLTVTNASDSVQVAKDGSLTFTPADAQAKAWYLNGGLLSSGTNNIGTTTESSCTVADDGKLTFSRGTNDDALYILTCIVDGGNAEKAKSFSFTVK